MITDYRANNMLPYFYGMTSGVIAANASVAVLLQFSQDAIFELHNIMGRSSVDVANDPHPNNFALSIKENATGNSLMNRPIGQALICGPSNLSLREFRPIQFSPSTQIEVTFQNLTGGNLTVELVFKGYKILRA